MSFPPLHAPNTPAPPHQGAGVVLNDVTLLRGSTTVFSQLHLQLTEQRIGLIGHNGVGKTSLFRLICGLDQPHAGHVRVAGHTAGAWPNARALVGMMFQNPDEQIIFPTVQEELALGLQSQNISRRDAIDMAKTWLAQRGLSNWAERAIGSLSQGQRQHVCWLAMLIAKPSVMLLDEPYASLDLPSQMRLRQDIDQCTQQIVVSTHALEHVRHFERVIWLDAQGVHMDGAGALVCDAYKAHTLQTFSH